MTQKETGLWIYIGKPPSEFRIPAPTGGNYYPSKNEANKIDGYTIGYENHAGAPEDWVVHHDSIEMVEVTWTQVLGDDGNGRAYIEAVGNQDTSVGSYDVDGKLRSSEMVFTGNYNVSYWLSNGEKIEDEISIVVYKDGRVFIRPSAMQDTAFTDLSAEGNKIIGITMGANIPNSNNPIYTGYDYFRGPRSFEYDEDSPPFACFVRGTMIQTDSGPVLIEQLQPGALVQTRDSGLQPIRWIGSSKLGVAILQANPNLRPIRINMGALGPMIPTADLLVSPQHRILIRSKIAQRMFSTDEVLVAAKQLLTLDGIKIAEDMPEVEYFHVPFDKHEIVISNGAETESLYTGPQALKSVGPSALSEIYTIFPELLTRDQAIRPEGARTLLTGQQGRKLAQRHAKNLQPLVAQRSC